MVTKEQIDIIKKYRGDIDMWARSGTKTERSLLGDTDWFTIDRLINDIHLIERHLVSPDYKQQVLNEIDQKVKKDAVDALYDLSRTVK